MDERIASEGMLMSAAAGLGIDQGQIRDAAYHVVTKMPLEEKATVCTLQRRLVAEHRISGADLAAMLAGITQRDVATLVLAKCQAFHAGERPPKREELRRLRQLERQARKPKEDAK